MAEINNKISFSVDKTGLDKVKQALQEIANTANSSVNDNIKGTIGKLNNALSDSYNSRLGTTELSKFNSLLKSQKINLSDVRNALVAVGKENVFYEMSSSLLSTNLNLKQSNEFLNKMAVTMGNTIRWNITAGILNTITTNISNAYSYIQRLDKSLNNIRIVTNKSADDMKQFAVEANNAAKALGSQTLEYTNASLIYYQQGLSDEEVKARTEVTLKAANVAKTSAQEMSEYLTAVWNGYQVSAQQAELYADKLSKVAASTASDLEELSTGMSRVASVANSLGVDIDQLNGMLATIISVTRQAPESAGVALKTVFSRIEDLSLGETDEEGVDFGTVDAELRKLGISIADETGKLRDLGDVVEDIGSKWQNWTKEQQTSIAVAMAGTRQYSNLFALFDNWDMYTEAVETSSSALGTLQQQQDTYMESIETKAKQLQTSWDSLYQNISAEDGIKAVLDIFSKLVDTASNFVKGLGGGLETLISLGSNLAIVFSGPISTGINNTITKVKALVTQEQQTAGGIAFSESLEKTLNDIKNKEGSQWTQTIGGLDQANIAYKEFLKIKNSLTEEEAKEAEATFQRLTRINQEISELTELKESYELLRLEKEKNNVIDSTEKSKRSAERKANRATEKAETKATEKAEQIEQEAQEAIDKVTQETKRQIEKAKADAKASFEKEKANYEKNILQVPSYRETSAQDYKDRKKAIDKQGQPYEQMLDNYYKQVEDLNYNELKGAQKGAATRKLKKQAKEDFDYISNDIGKLYKELEKNGNNESAIFSLKEIKQLNKEINNDIDSQNIDLGKFLQLLTQIVEKVKEARQANQQYSSTTEPDTEAIENEAKKTEESKKASIEETKKKKLDELKETTQKELDNIQKTKQANIEAAEEEKNIKLQSIQEQADKQKAKEQEEETKKLKGFQEETEKNTDQIKTLTEIGNERKDTEKFIKVAMASVQVINSAVRTISVLFDKTATTSEKINATVSSIQSSLYSVGTLIGEKFGNAALGGAIGMVASTVLGVIGNEVTKYYAEQEEKLKELQDRYNKFGETAQDLTQKIFKFSTSLKETDLTDLSKEFKTLSEGVSKYGENISLTAEEYSRYNEILSELIGYNDKIVLGYTTEGQAIVDKNTALEDTISLLRQQLEEEQKLLGTEEMRKAIFEQIRDTQSEILNNYFDQAGSYNFQSFGSFANAAFANPQSYFDSDTISKETTEYLEKLKEFSKEGPEYIAENFEEFEETLNSVRNSLSEAGKGIFDAFFEDFDPSEITQYIDLYKKTQEEMVAATKPLNQSILAEVLAEGDRNEKIHELGLYNAFSAYINSLDVSMDKTKEAKKEFIEVYDTLIEAMGQENSRLTLDMINELQSLENISFEDYSKVLKKILNNATEAEKGAFKVLLGIELTPEGELKTQLDERINNLQERVDRDFGEKGIKINVRTDLSTNDPAQMEKIIASLNKNKDRIVDDESARAEIKRQTEFVYLNSQVVKSYNDVNDAIEQIRDNKELDEKLTQKLIALDNNLADIRDKNSQAFLDRLIQVRESLESQNIAMQQALVDYHSDNLIAIDLNTEEAEKDIESFFDAHSEFDVHVKADLDSDIGDITSGLETIENAAKNVGEGFIIAADDIITLGKAFPGILEDIEYLADGTIRLNKQVVESAVQSAQAESDASIESAKAQLISMITLYKAKAAANRQAAELANKLANSEGETEQEVSKLKGQLAEKVTEIKEINNQIMAENSTKEAQSEIDNLAAIGEQSGYTAVTMVDNFNNAFETMVENAIAAANKIAEAFAAAAQGKTYEDSGVSLEGIDAISGADSKVNVTNTYVGETSNNLSNDELFRKNLELEAKKYLLQAETDEALAEELELTLLGLEAKQNEVNAGLSNVMSGKGYKGKSSSGGSKDQKDQRDIYHEINIELELLEKNLKRVQDQEDKLYGKDYLDNLETQLAYYNRQNELLKEKKQKIQERDLAIRKEDLLSRGVKFNEDGDILNYNDLVNIDGMKEAMDAYETTLYNTVEDTKDKLLEIEDAMYDIALKKFTFQVDIEVEVDDARKKWKDFLDEMANYTEDNIIDPLNSNINLFDSLTEDDSSLIHLTDKVNEIIGELQKGSEGLFSGREAEGLEQLENYQDQLMEALTDINDIQKEIEEAYLKFIDKAKNEFGEHVDQFERLTDILSHQNTLIELIYGDKSYDLFDQMYEAQHQNNIGQLDFYRQQIIYWEQLRDTFEEGTDEWDAANKNLQDTQAALNKLVEDSIKNIIEQYENAVNSIFTAVDNKITSGLGLDNVGELWDQALYLQDKYLDNTEKIVEQQKLENKFTEALNNTDNIKQQEKLKNVQDYLLKGLREKEKLTQYDIDRAQLMYEIALKELALEDAKNAKTSMRLVRDTQGNWKYEYTADQDAIDKAQGDLLDTKSDLYKLDKDAYTANLQEMYDIYAEWQEKVRALYADTTLDAEEKERKKKEYAEYYGQLIDEITQQNQEIRVNITSSAFDAINEVYLQDIENVTGLTEAEMEMIKNMTEDFKNNYFMFEQSVKENWDNISDKSGETMGNILGIWTSAVQEMVSNFAESDDSFKNICLDVYDQLDEATEDYRDRLQELEDAAGNNFTNIADNIENVNDQTNDLIDFTDELIGRFYDEQSAIEDLMRAYEGIVDRYDDMKRAALSAADAAREYAEAMREAAAHSVGEGSYESNFTPSYGSGNAGSSGSSGSGSAGSGVSSGATSATKKIQYQRTYVPKSYMTKKKLGSSEIITLGTRTDEQDYTFAMTKRKNSDKNVQNYLDTYYGEDDPITMAGWYWELEKKIIKAKKGGLIKGLSSIGENAIVAAREGERILSEQQTKAFDEFVYNFMPHLMNAISEFKASKISSFNRNNNYTSMNTDNSQSMVYQIENINFPNATDSNEIMEALNNLSGAASQYINTRIR